MPKPSVSEAPQNPSPSRAASPSSDGIGASAGGLEACPERIVQLEPHLANLSRRKVLLDAHRPEGDIGSGPRILRSIESRSG